MLPCRTPFDTLNKVEYVPPQRMHICWLAYQKDNMRIIYWGVPLLPSFVNNIQWLTRSKALLASKKTSKHTAIHDSVSINDLLKNIYALICAVIPFESELIRTSIKITRYTIKNNAFSNFANNTSKCNRTVIIFRHDTSGFRFNYWDEYVINHAFWEKTMYKETSQAVTKQSE